MIFSLTNIQEDLIFKICTFLPKDDLLRLGQVCKILSRITADDHLWRPNHSCNRDSTLSIYLTTENPKKEVIQCAHLFNRVVLTQNPSLANTVPQDNLFSCFAVQEHLLSKLETKPTLENLLEDACLKAPLPLITHLITAGARATDTAIDNAMDAKLPEENFLQLWKSNSWSEEVKDGILSSLQKHNYSFTLGKQIFLEIYVRSFDEMGVWESLWNNDADAFFPKLNLFLENHPTKEKIVENTEDALHFGILCHANPGMISPLNQAYLEAKQIELKKELGEGKKLNHELHVDQRDFLELAIDAEAPQEICQIFIEPLKRLGEKDWYCISDEQKEYLESIDCVLE